MSLTNSLVEMGKFEIDFILNYLKPIVDFSEKNIPFLEGCKAENLIGLKFEGMQTFQHGEEGTEDFLKTRKGSAALKFHANGKTVKTSIVFELKKTYQAVAHDGISENNWWTREVYISDTESSCWWTIDTMYFDSMQLLETIQPNHLGQIVPWYELPFRMN